MLAKTEGFVKQKIGQNPKKTLFPRYFFPTAANVRALPKKVRRRNVCGLCLKIVS